MMTLKILIADDHDIVREGMRKLLQTRSDWEICAEAATGREAVEKAILHRPDVVVLDFSMPELNGVDATREIRQALPKTEVLMLTMHESEQLAREALDAGALGFLLKNDAKRHLVAAVEALAEVRPFIAPSFSALFMDRFAHPEKQTTGTTGDRLTPREREVTQLIAEGRTSKEVAVKLNVSVKTVDAHRANIMGKLNLHSVSELVLYAVRNKIISP